MIGGIAAMLGALLNLILGLSRVWLAMGRRNDMPAASLQARSSLFPGDRDLDQCCTCPHHRRGGRPRHRLELFRLHHPSLLRDHQPVGARTRPPALDRMAGADLVRLSLVLRASEGLGHWRCPRLYRFGLAGASPRLKPDIGTLTPVPPHETRISPAPMRPSRVQCCRRETPTETISVVDHVHIEHYVDDARPYPSHHNAAAAAGLHTGSWRHGTDRYRLRRRRCPGFVEGDLPMLRPRGGGGREQPRRGRRGCPARRGPRGTASSPPL